METTIVQKQIPTFHMGDFQKALASLNRKARKLGLPDTTFETTGTEIIKTEVGYEDFGNGQTRALYRMIEHTNLVIHGPIVKLRGYTLRGVVEPELVGGEMVNLVRSIGGDLPERYRAATMECEHCHKTRRRHRVYVLEREVWTHGFPGPCVPAEYIQVGSGCVVDFLGGQSGDTIAAQLTIIAELIKDSFGECERGSGGYMLAVSPRTFVCYVLADIAARGYVKKDMPGIATSVQAWVDCTDKHKAIKDEEILIEAWGGFADQVIAYWRDCAGVSDFEHNVKHIVQMTTITHRHTGYLAGAVAGWHKAMGKKHEDAAKPVSLHYRKIGERVRGVAVTVVESRCLGEGTYGFQYLHTFATQTGAILKWFTGTGPGGICFALTGSYSGVPEGLTGLLTATVEKHDEYKGRQETVIKRAKLAPVAPLEPAQTTLEIDALHPRAWGGGVA